jgi:hypothetical protein
MKLGSIHIIQRPKNNPKNGDTVVPHVQRSSKHRSHQVSVFWDKDRILLVDYLHKIPPHGSPSLTPGQVTSDL